MRPMPWRRLFVAALCAQIVWRCSVQVWLKHARHMCGCVLLEEGHGVHHWIVELIDMVS